MIKISVMYPVKPGARFDHDYYRSSHMPMIGSLLGPALKGWSIDKGLASGLPGSALTYVAIGHLACESVEAFQAAFGPHAQHIMADIASYTDITPLIQVSEIVVE